MKIIIAGGSGYLGNVLINFYKTIADEIVILSRHDKPAAHPVRYVKWDGENLGPWTYELENADVLINLAGKSVNCRYTEKNKKEILHSRVRSTQVLGEAVTHLKFPPALWIQSASATIYHDSHDLANTEQSVVDGSNFSEMVCMRWEKTFNEIILPKTRKVILRIGIVLGTSDGALPRLIKLTKTGLGGYQGNGRQFISWIHEKEIPRITEWLRTHPVATGVFNCTSVQPVTNKDFMKELRSQLGISFGIPTPEFILKIGAMVIGTETELILKSRKVYPQRLLDNKFVFEFPDVKSALVDLCQREKRS